MSDNGFWQDHVFVLASPDALHRGLAPRWVARLRQEGFEPVAARLVRTDAEMIDELYADLIAGQWQTWRYRLIDDAFALGPTLAMLCRWQGGADDPHELLQRRKGHQHPHLAEPGSIRSDLGAVNSILGIMHAADDPAQARSDARVYGLSEADLDGEAGDTAAYLDHLVALTRPSRPETRDYEAVLADVRARLLLAARPRLGRPLLGTLADEFAEPTTLARLDAPERLRHLLDGRVPESLLTVLTCPFTPQWRETRRTAPLFAALREHGVDLDPWERVVLETSLYFPSARRTPVGQVGR